MLMKSRPYTIPYPAEPGIDSGPAVGHQQQAVREDISRIGFPEGVEQKTSQYGNEADVDVELIHAMSIRVMPIRTELIRHLVRSAPCGMPSRLVRSAPYGMPRRLVSHVPDNFRLPTFLKTVDTEHQHAQIQNILPCIAPFDISPTERTFIDFLKKCTPSSVGSQGSLSAGIGLSLIHI